MVKITRLKSLLKKLTLIDYIIIATVLIGIVIIYFFFNPKEEWINVVIIDEKVPVNQVAALKKDDFEVDSSGNKIAKLKSADIYDTPGNEDIEKKAVLNVDLLVNISRSNEYEFKNKIIKVGSPIEIRFSNELTNGNIIQIGNSNYAKTSKIITVKLYSQWPWFADSIKIGSQEQTFDHQKLIQVISKEVTPAEITVDTANGARVLSIDPQKVDITLKLQTWPEDVNGDLVLRKEKRLIIGDLFPFLAGDIRVKDDYITNIE